jgi:phage-related protein
MSIGPEEKPVFFLDDGIKTPPLSGEARRESGGLLRRLQDGESLGMPHSRPMPSIGRGVHELRVRDGRHNWRIIYRVETDIILVVLVFAKTTKATPKPMIDLARKRLADHDAR